MCTALPKLPSRTLSLLLCLLLTLLLTACSTTAHYPINPVMDGRKASQEYRFRNLDKKPTSDSLSMVVSFSGGGTRASAFAHGVLEELAEMRIKWDGKERILLDEIDVISSVSGGSITAAHYGLRREHHFAEFPERYLYNDLQGGILDRLFSLQILSQLGSSYFGRIEVVASKLDSTLFKGATFDTLAKNGTKPYLIINATDMSSGARFHLHRINLT